MEICPKCERELKSANQWHNCVKVDIGDLFKNKPKELEYLFDQLLLEVTEWDDVAVSATQNCIVFVHNQTFLIIRPMRSQLDIKFYSAAKLNDPLVLKSIAYSGRYENHIRVAADGHITPAVFSYIKQSYKLL